MEEVLPGGASFIRNTETILDKLQLLVEEGVFFGEEDHLDKLKGELEEVRKYFRAAWNLEMSFKSLVDFVCDEREQIYSSSELDQASSSVDSITAASIFGDFLKNFRQQTRLFDDSVHQGWQGFYSLLLKDGLPSTVADRESIVNFGQQIRDFYKRMWDSMVPLFSDSRTRYLQQRWVNDLTGGWEEMSYEKRRLIDLFTSFQRDVECILRLGILCDSRFAEVLKPVLIYSTLRKGHPIKRFPFVKHFSSGWVNGLKFIKRFPFVKHFSSGWVNRGNLSYHWMNRLEYIERFPFAALFAARLCCWFLRDRIHLNTSESVEQINPAADQASLAYTGVWESESRSLTLSSEAMTSIDSIIDFCKDDHDLKELKVELSLVKIFFLCARKLCFSSKRTEILKDSVRQNWQQFCSFLAQLEHGLPPSELAGAISNLRRILKSYRQKFSTLYVEMPDFLFNRYGYCSEGHNSYVDSLLKSSSGLRDEFMELFNLLLENLEDIVIWGKACDSRLAKLLEPLQEKLVFLRTFILFPSLQGKPKRKLLEHCAVVALSAAHLCYICWFFRYHYQELNWMDSKISELTDKIKLVDHRAHHTYICVLESGTTSPTLSTEKDVIIVGEFVESLLGHLWELLLNCPAYFAVSLKHQLRMLFEGLQFLRNILNKEKYDGIEGKIKDLIRAVVNDAGIVILSLYQNDLREASAEEIDVKLFCLLEKIKPIKAEVEEKYPIPPKFGFPTTDALGLIDLVQEKLQELASCKVDPIFTFANDRVHFLRSYLKNAMEEHNQDAKHQAQTIQEDLSFLKSFLENNLEQHTEKEKLHIQTMQDGLVFLRSFLENNRDQRNHLAELQALSSHVVEVAYKAVFVIDSLIVGDLSYYSLMLFDDVTAETKLLKTKTWEIDSIEAQKPADSLRDVPSQGKKWSGVFHQVPSQGTISTINKVAVCLKDQEQAIIDQLIGGSLQLDIISIVGMPGLGKTFLAERVYHNPSITSHFHILAWCCISQVYCKKDLLLGILACIDPKAQYSEFDEDDLAHKLCNHLRKRKYLIVLDDIWDIEAWNALKISFPDHTNGSRILLTSRHHGITGKPHHLRPLHEEESWELLQKKLSVTREEGFPPELTVLGRQIAKNCNGLPLSIIIISGILETLDQGRWGEVAEKLDSNSKIGATEQCKSILELSYMHLPDDLKPCLLYFSAFREDQEISVKRLMWLWIAEGFVRKKESESLEKSAEGYLIALINRSLVMEGQKRSIGGVKTCHIHDLLHVFCLGKAKDQNFLHLIQGCDRFLNFDEPRYLHRLSIHFQPNHFVKSKIFCPHVRSLLHSSRGIGSRVVSYNLSFVCHLKLLQVLDLEQINLGFNFLCELGLLIQLRYLAVSGWIKYIPPSLENLSNLETFRVTTYYSDFVLSSLVDIFWKLQKLRHFQVRGALICLSLGKENPESSCMSYNLHTFSTPKLYLGQSMEKMIMKFPNIRRLKCCLLQSEESCSESTRIVAMDSLSQLESLKLLLGKVTANCIEFHLPLNLKKLTLEDFSRSIICTIRKLPNLEVLKLIRQADGEKEWDMGDMEEEEFFPKLKFLKLESLKVVRWMGTGEHFPSLERLILEGCVQLEELPSCLQATLTLQLIEVHGCLYLAGKKVQGIKKQQDDYREEDLKIVISDEIEESSSCSDRDSDGWLPEEIDSS
ncbi:putative late blight resistance protein homolog R1B-8 isoform X2 [Coffea arabica]|uniref:Late blight resistance protein homolog R1B-8 isoform X2 n=1 Tax=Coffea arabica TaxID=13443 RepID=A0A6P6VHA7_COFAR|nr:putative late blight resistance protein homolog R1B-8 isoform X2 [Coffea arabica]